VDVNSHASALLPAKRVLSKAPNSVVADVREGVGAVLLRTETELILKSRRVVPGRLLESGFTFLFPKWSDAAGDLCHERREVRRAQVETSR